MKRILAVLLMLLLCVGTEPAMANSVCAETKGGVTIITQPQDVMAAEGETVRFTVKASGDNLTYRWQYKTPAGEWAMCGLTGAKTATLSVPVAAMRNRYQYRCKVTGAGGVSVLSDAAKLTVKTVIIGQPKNYVGRVGSTATFTVAASGANLSYLWLYKSPTGDWTACGLTGARTDTLIVPVTGERNKYQYRCRVTGADCPAVTSSPATLTVNTVVIDQPKSICQAVGTTARFTFSASGARLTHQWQYKTPTGNWTTCSLPGAKGDTLLVPVTAVRNGYQYRCRVTSANGVSVTSKAVTLTVKTTVTAQPKDVTAAVGDTARFTVKATGALLTYRWQFNNGTGWQNATMTGYNTTALSVPVKTARNGYRYRCRITDANGKTTYTNAATLIVTK